MKTVNLIRNKTIEYVLHIRLLPESKSFIDSNNIKYIQISGKNKCTEESLNIYEFASLCKEKAAENIISLKSCRLLGSYQDKPKTEPSSICWFHIPIKPYTEIQIKAETEPLAIILALEWLIENKMIKDI